MRKTWMLVSSIAVSAAIVLAPTAYAAVNNSNTTGTTTQQTASTKDNSSGSGEIGNMMNGNGTANMMNNKGMSNVMGSGTVQKMMGAMGSPEGQKMVNDCSSFLNSYNKSK